MKITVSSAFHLSEFRLGDKAALVEHLKEKQIYDQTLAIPFPYTESDADWWLHHNIEKAALSRELPTSFALRRSEDGFLIGAVGLERGCMGQDHRAEIGYWLAKPFWNQGIMTAAIKAASEYAFESIKLVRLTAHVFDFNHGSARALEKAGFQLEAMLRAHYKKNGRVLDGKLYSRVKL